MFFELANPIPDGAAVEVSFDNAAFQPVVGTYSADTISEAIHVNLMGFDPDDSIKTAFLSSWNGWSVENGSDVAQVYRPGMTFDVVDEATGQSVKTGVLELYRAETDPQNFWNNYQFADVWRMDFADVTANGTFHVLVNGIGRSQSFEISDDHWGEIFDVSFSGFYHQRSGIALEEEYTDWTRPRSFHPDDGFVIQETTLDLTDTSEGPLGGSVDPFTTFSSTTTGNVLGNAWGGWHDAGDYDRRSQHLETSRKLMELIEIAPSIAMRDASIPERGDSVPDLLDEAMWNLDLFRRLQKPDGGVRGGIESESFPARGEGSWADSLNHYAYAPDPWSSYEFAATAAKAAFLFQDLAPGKVAQWRDAAERAWDWAEANPKTLTDAVAIARMDTAKNTAAAELFRLTGANTYHQAFQDTFAYAGGINNVAWYAHQYEGAFTYARTPGAISALSQNGQNAILANANFERTVSDRGGFGETINPYAPYGWGNTSTHTDEAELFIRAHVLTDDDIWVPEIQADMQYPLGANPMNLSYVTGLGSRQPEEVLLGDMDVLGRDDAPPGITLYGPYSIHDYGQDFYHDIMWPDVFPNFWRAPISESFQGFQVFVPSTEFTVQQGIADTTYASGYLASLQEPAAPGPQPINGTDGDDILLGTAEENILNGLGGRDLIKGLQSDDSLYGGSGNDNLEGNGGADLLDGGPGDRDMAEYFNAPDGVEISLSDPTQIAGTDAVGDVLVGIEDLAGSNHDDVLTGDGGTNYLFGRLGNDTLDGGGSKDWMDGSHGDDRLIFRDADAGIGGKGADIFEFHSGFYQVVGIFHASQGDRLDISNLGFATKADFLATAIDIFGMHTRFEIGGSHNIQLNFTDISDIGEDQVILI